MRWSALCLLGIAVGCATRAPSAPLGPWPTRELARWQVSCAAQPAGLLLQISIDDPRGAVVFYRFLNQQGQWLGHIDNQGRVYQRVPFTEVDVFRGLHPLPAALALLSELQGPFELSPLGAAPAAPDLPAAAEVAAKQGN